MRLAALQFLARLQGMMPGDEPLSQGPTTVWNLVDVLHVTLPDGSTKTIEGSREDTTKALRELGWSSGNGSGGNGRGET